MASLKFLESAVDHAKQAVEKLEKKLQRIKKAEENNWENNPYYYGESDKSQCLKEIENKKKKLAEYESMLYEAKERESSRNIKVLVDFLNEWKNKVFVHYEDALKKYYGLAKEIKNARDEMNNYAWKSNNYTQAENKLNDLLLIRKEKIEGKFTKVQTKYGPMKKKVTNGEWEFIAPYINCGGIEKSLEKVNEDLDKEKDRKYDFIVLRTKEIVGTITDASNLHIVAGELNGFIIGMNGKAKVSTIGCGGYNIQCFHFRTLINKVN